MTEHVLTLNAAAIEVNRQPKCKEPDHAAMIKNKLRVTENGSGMLMLQIRGENHYAQVALSGDSAEWLAGILNDYTGLTGGQVREVS